MIHLCLGWTPVHISLCLCLCLCPAGAGRAGQSPRRYSQALCLTSSGLLCVFVSFSHPVLCVIAHTFRQFSGFICDGPETSNGRGATSERPQPDAPTARSASCGLTADADATGWFRCGITTIANSRSSTTTQPGDDTASAENAIAQAKQDPATIQPDANATHGLDTHLSQERWHHWHNTSETQPRECAARATRARRAIFSIPGKAGGGQIGNSQQPVRTTYHR